MSLDDAIGRRKPLPTGALIAVICLLLVALLGFLNPALESLSKEQDEASSLSFAGPLIGLVINSAFVALLFFARRRWVAVVFVMRSLFGIAYDVYNAFDLREKWGDWTFLSSHGGRGWILLGLGVTLNIVLIGAISNAFKELE